MFGTMLSFIALTSAAPSSSGAPFSNSANPFSDLQSYTPELLIESSFGRGPEGWKTHVRTYVAHTVPNTAPGLFASAWLNGQVKRPNDEIYAKCLQLDPSYIPCLNNSSFRGRPDQEILAIFAPALKENPLYPALLENIILDLSPTGRDAFIAEWRQKIPDAPDILARDAEIAAKEGNISEALAIYERILHGPHPHQVYITTAWLDLWFKQASNGRMSSSERLEYITNALKDDISRPDKNLLAQKADIAAIWVHMAKLFGTELKDFYLFQIVLSQAWNVFPCRDVVSAAIDSSKVDVNWQKSIAEDAMIKLPYDPLVLANIANLYWIRLWDPVRSRKLFQLALNYAHSEPEQARILELWTWAELQMVNPSKSLELIRPLKEIPSTQDIYYQRSIDIAASIGDQAFKTSLIEEYRHSLSNPNLSWFAKRYIELNAQFFIPKLSPISLSMVQGSVISATRDGSRVVLGSDPPVLWDLRRQQPIAQLGTASTGQFSPDGSYLAMSSQYSVGDNEYFCNITLYDAKTGQKLYSSAPSASNGCDLSTPSWSPDSAEFSVVTSSGLLLVINASTKQARVVRVSTINIDGESAWAGENLYVALSQENLVYVLDPATLQTVRTEPGVSWVHAMGVSGDGSILVIHDNQSQLLVWNVLTGSKKTFSLKGSAWTIHVDQTGKEALIKSRFQTALYRVNLATGKAQALYTGTAEDTKPSGVFLDNNRILISTPKGLELQASDATNFLIEPFLTNPKSFTTLTDGVYLIQDKDMEWVLDGSRGSLTHRRTTPTEHYTRLQDGSYAWIEEKNKLVIQTAQGSSYTLPLDFYPQTLIGRWSEAGPSPLVVGGVPMDPKNGTQDMPDKGIMLIVDAKTGKTLHRTEFPMRTRLADYPGLFKTAVAHIALHPSESVVAWSTSFSVGYGHPLEESDQLSWLNYSTQKTGSFRVGSPIDSLWFTDTGALGISSKSQKSYWDVLKGAKTFYTAPPEPTRYSVGPAIIEFSSSGEILQLLGSGGFTNQYNSLPGEKIWLTLESNIGRINWSRFNGQPPIASLQLFADGTWAAWTDGSHIWGNSPAGRLLQQGAQGWQSAKLEKPEGFAAALASVLGL